MTKTNDFDKILEDRIAWVKEQIGCTQQEARILVELKLTSLEHAQAVIEGGKAPEGNVTGTPKTVDKLGSRRAGEVKAVVAAEPKSKIDEKELDRIVDFIKENLGDKVFANKDLAPGLSSIGLTARQTPSRLKKLVEMGIISDEGGSPKKYKLK